MLYTLICNGMRKEVKSIWWDQGGECWIGLSTNGPNGPLGPWLASGSGTPSPLEGWWALSRSTIRGSGGHGSDYEVRRRHRKPHTPNPSRPRGSAKVTGSTTGATTLNLYSDRRCQCAYLHRRSSDGHNSRGKGMWFAEFTHSIYY
jgi:hypothetical protein